MTRPSRVLVTFAVVLLLAVSSASGVAQAPPPASTQKPVASIKELHDILITPASDAVFASGANAPANDAAWRALRGNALLLAESGNLLMTSTRALDNDKWMTMSRAFVDAAALAASAAAAKDAGRLSDASDQIVTACETCHEPYRDHGRRMPR